MDSPLPVDAAATLAALGGAGAARGAGAVEAVQDLVPEWLALAVALVTQLGDPWFLAVVLAGLYWAYPRHREGVAAVAGLTLAASGLVVTLKYAFAFPRPGRPLVALAALPPLARPVYELTGTASGYGFPSGHALATTVVFLGLATVLPFWSYRRRVAGALAVVAVVSLSRIALGVHYLVDVLAGVAVGVAFLLVARAAMARAPTDGGTAAFGFGVGLGGTALVVSAADPDAVLLMGAALGAFGGWQLVALGRELFAVGGPGGAVGPIARRSGLAAAALLPLWYVLEYLPALSVPWLAGALGAGVAAVLVVPAVRGSDRTPLVLAALAFWTAAALGTLRDLVSETDLPGWLRPGRG